MMTAEEKLTEIEESLKGIVATIDKHYERDDDGNIIDRFYDGYRFAVVEILQGLEAAKDDVQPSPQARALEALRVAAKVVSDKLNQDFTLTTDRAGNRVIGIAFNRQEIEALRAALRQAEEGGA